MCGAECRPPPAGAPRQEPFRAQVPVLEDGDLTLFESRAVARHVLRKHKPELLGGGSLAQAATVDVWLEVEAHQVHPAAAAEQVRWYLAGDFLSLADLSHFAVMHYFMATEYAETVEARPHVKAWWQQLAARPAAKKGG